MTNERARYDERVIDGPDGRLLEVATIGPPSGRTVVFHHGTPGAATLVRLFEDVATEFELFVTCVSRPGYGGSTRREGRVVASVVDDVHAALDALGRGRYLSVGWSGGGPHSLACAVLGAPRCLAAWSLAGVAPMDVDFDWTDGMGPENLEEFALAREGGPAYETFMVEAAASFAAATPDTVVELFGGLLSPVDRAALEPVADRSVLAEAMERAFATGWRGFYDDDRAMFEPWGFDLTANATPVAIWFAEHDLMVPSTHGRWLSSHVAMATASYFADDGHVSLVCAHRSELAAALAEPTYAGASPVNE